MNGPLVSVIIPCFNYAHFLPQTLSSVCNQSYQNWEVIIVDDGSTDDTRQIANQFVEKDSRFKYIYQINQGLSAARNTGLSAGKGKYIQFLDADDLIESDKLEFQVEFLESNVQVDVVYGQVKYFDFIYPDKILIKEVYKVSGFSGNGKNLSRELVHSNITPVHAPLLRSKLFSKDLIFDVNFKSLEDWDFWWKCSGRAITFQYLPAEDTAALYRIHANSMTKDKWKMHYAELQLREKMVQHIIDEPELLRLNLSILRKIKNSLIRYAWNDSIQGKAIQASDKFVILFRQYKQIKFLINSKLVKYLPTKLIIVIYYLIYFSALTRIVDNKLKKTIGK